MKTWKSLSSRTCLRHVAQYCLVGCLAFAGWAHAARIKEVASIEGVRSNQLTGYGLVVGLDSGAGNYDQLWLARATKPPKCPTPPRA